MLSNLLWFQSSAEPLVDVCWCNHESTFNPAQQLVIFCMFGTNPPLQAMDFAQAMAFLDCNIPIEKVLRRNSSLDLGQCNELHLKEPGLKHVVRL